MPDPQRPSPQYKPRSGILLYSACLRFISARRCLAQQQQGAIGNLAAAGKLHHVQPREMQSHNRGNRRRRTKAKQFKSTQMRRQPSRCVASKLLLACEQRRPAGSLAKALMKAHLCLLLEADTHLPVACQRQDDVTPLLRVLMLKEMGSLSQSARALC